MKLGDGLSPDVPWQLHGLTLPLGPLDTTTDIVAGFSAPPNTSNPKSTVTSDKYRSLIWPCFVVNKNDTDLRVIMQ